MLAGHRSNTGALYVTQGPPPAGTPLVGGIAVSAAGVIYANGQGVPSVWTPEDLFLNSEQGAWYDPSDLSTMFQDRAGATPVTADGQPVGLILDKSHGLVLGPESCPTFTNANWGDAGAIPSGWVLSGGVLTVTTSAQWDRIASTLSQNALNKWFVCSINVQSVSGNVSISAWLNWAGGLSTERSITVTTPGIKSLYFYSNDAAAGIDIQVISSGASIVINSISVKAIAGNHAVAPSDAARPLYKTDGTYHWLQFDGVDDRVATANIDLTSTDELCVFSGCMKSGAGVYKILVDNTLNADTTEGSFEVFEPGGTETTSQSYVKGNILQANVSSTSPASGNKYTLARQFDLASFLKANTNGGAFTTTSSVMGGNFANDILTVGSRGSGAYFLNGQIYSLIVLGRLATTQEITDTETWVNTKTGAY